MNPQSIADVEVALAARWPESKLDPSLTRIRDLVTVLGDPQDAVPVIMVAGTNGKTSTARMIDSVLRGFGLRVGRYTSPHLESVTERITLDGEPVPQDRFVAAYTEIEPYLQLVDSRHPVPLSYFEVLTALAYSIFADAPVDVAVIEVGMGGTWDATNVANAQVAVVTPIALDHQAYLGDTIEEIAAEKAGIIGPEAVAVVAQQTHEAAQVLLGRAAEVGATVAREGLEFAVVSRTLAVGGQLLDLKGLGGQYDEVVLTLMGAHQAHNAAVALAAVEAFLGGGAGRLDIDVIRAGFAAATSPGRLEVVRRGPTVVIDAAHNPDGARALAAALSEDFAFDRLVGVIGVLSDKDAAGLLEALEPVLSQLVITSASSPRALDPDELARIAVSIFGADRVVVVPALADAIADAVALAEEYGPLAQSGVLVTGSVVTAGQARAMLVRGG